MQCSSANHLVMQVKTMPGNAFVLALAAFAGLPAGHPGPDVPLTITAPPAILHSGSGATVLTIHNAGAAPQNLSLSSGPFTNTSSHALLRSPKISFTQVTGGGPYAPSVPPNGETQVLATIADDNEAGTSEVEIFNGGSHLTTLRAIGYDQPFNVGVDADAGGRILLHRQQPATLKLKNGDNFLYPVEWRFETNGGSQGGTLLLAPNSSGQVQVSAPKKATQWTEWLWPHTQPASLLLRLSTPPEVKEYLPPWHTIPLTAELTRFGTGYYKTLSYLLVFALLFLGASCSLLASSFLPYVVRRVALQRKLDDLASRTSSISTRVDSLLRVLLRLERKSIASLFGSVKWYSTDQAVIFDQISAGIERVDKRLRIAERLDQLRILFDDVSCDAPPSVSDSVDQTLQKAANALHTFVLQDKDIALANALLDKAAALLQSLTDPSICIKDVTTRFAQLKRRQVRFQSPTYAAGYQEMQAALPGIFSVLDQPYDVPENLTPPMIFGVDHAISAINSAFDALVVRASTSDATLQGRLSQHFPELKRLLGTPAWPALQAARNLVQQMREDVYEIDLLEELARDGQADIVLDTQVARPYLPIYLSIAFRRSAYNGSAAISGLSCDWFFPDDLQEKGWKICHFFTTEGIAKVEAVVSSQVPDGRPAPTRKVKNITVRRAPRSPSPQLFAELVRFAITLFIALAGLVAGAQQQLQKLDLLPAMVAVFLIGFGADSVKNLLSQAPSRTTPA
jgi:hypothetical protein